MSLRPTVERQALQRDVKMEVRTILNAPLVGKARSRGRAPSGPGAARGLPAAPSPQGCVWCCFVLLGSAFFKGTKQTLFVSFRVCSHTLVPALSPEEESEQPRLGSARPDPAKVSPPRPLSRFSRRAPALSLLIWQCLKLLPSGSLSQ